jgi:hypothetical protein
MLRCSELHLLGVTWTACLQELIEKDLNTAQGGERNPLCKQPPFLDVKYISSFKLLDDFGPLWLRGGLVAEAQEAGMSDGKRKKRENSYAMVSHHQAMLAGTLNPTSGESAGRDYGQGLGGLRMVEQPAGEQQLKEGLTLGPMGLQGGTTMGTWRMGFL